MLPPKCMTCGTVLAHIEIHYENELEDINNNPKFSDDEKSQKKKDLVDKFLGGIHKYKYCCRSKLISYIDLIDIII